MSSITTAPFKQQRPLRLWPGLILVGLQWLLWLVVPFFVPKATGGAMIAGVLCGLAVLLWWLIFSRAPWLERITAIGLMVVGVLATKLVVHPSILGGMMGMMLPIFAIPVLCLALVIWATATRHLSNGVRRVSLVVAILLGCSVFTLLRTGGITGDAASDFHWRWTKTPEEILMAQAANETTTPLAVTPSSTSNSGATPGWPGFRGTNRDGVIHGVRIETDWAKKPPVAIWRKPIGPGWSSFAVLNNLIYTQEQRGESEDVSCYNLTNGQPVWRHSDAARFYESNAGPGPRGTPTLDGDRVYTFGATGIVNALNALNGSVIWTRNAAADTKTKTPHWGFASSPLVVGDIVIVAASGALAAYDINNGTPRWYGPGGGRGYSSPQLVTIAGVPQVLLLNGEGVISVDPTNGALLWKHVWESDGIVQPASTSDGDVLIGSGSGLGAELGMRRVAISRDSGQWAAKERWTSTELNPYFNDFVVSKNYAYGFDGSELACIDLKDGAGKWRGGNYGHGQLVLLADQDILLVVSESGELALVKANPDQFNELTRFRALEGKTWNHPVIVEDMLLVRNGEEMAAFRLSLVH